MIQAEVREYWVEWTLHEHNNDIHEKEDYVLSYSSDELHTIIIGSEYKNHPACSISIKRIATKAQHEIEIKE